jgi:hypothetical protein
MSVSIEEMVKDIDSVIASIGEDKIVNWDVVE